MEKLGEALIASPDKAYMAVITGDPDEVTMPAKGSPTNQEERWKILEAYREYLDKEPEGYQE